MTGVTQKLKQKIEEEENRLQMLKDLENVSPKARSAKVNGSAFHARKGFKPTMRPLPEKSITNQSINGHKTETKLSNKTPVMTDKFSIASNRNITGSNANLRIPSQNKDDTHANNVGLVSRKQSIRDVEHIVEEERSMGMLDVNGVGIRPSYAPSRLSTKTGGAAVTAPSRLSKYERPSVNAPSRLSVNQTTSLNVPSRMSMKASPTPVNRDGISGNTFFSNRGSVPPSANKTRPVI